MAPALAGSDESGRDVDSTVVHVVADTLAIDYLQLEHVCAPGLETGAGIDPPAEFIILLPHVNGPTDANKVARRILESLSEKFTIDHQEMFVTTSIGIAVFPDDGETAIELMKNADIAMYSAKKLGRNNFQYYSSKLNDAAVHKLEIESRLRRAVDFLHHDLHLAQLGETQVHPDAVAHELLQLLGAKCRLLCA